MKRIIILQTSNFLAAVIGSIVTLMVILGPLIPAYGQFNKQIIGQNLYQARQMQIVDLDNDGDLDVIAAGETANRVVWYEAPEWTKHNIVSLGGVDGLCVIDMDEDEDLDVVTSGYSSNTVGWCEAPSWTFYVIDNNLDSASDLDVGDMDDDGDYDVVVSSYYSPDLVWYEAPSWTKYYIDENATGSQNIKVADIDSDNDLDVIATCKDANQVVWYEAPLWSKHLIDESLRGARGLEIIDMNSDNIPDIVVTALNDGEVIWYETPSWTKHVIDDNSPWASDVCVADINGDNTLDVAVVSRNEDYVVWYKGPSWTKYVIDESLDGARIVKGADIDADNDLDLVVTGYYANNVVLYDNLGSNTAYAETMEVFPLCLSFQGDSLTVRAHLNNPQNHPAAVHAMINGDGTAFQDSIELFDDGLHDDESDSDNLWSGSKCFSGLEEANYKVVLLTRDLTEGTTHRLIQEIRFTTIGPVVFDTLTFRDSDTAGIPGKRQRVYITLKNAGSTVTATNLYARLISLDTLLLSVPDYSRSLDDIAPGETATTSNDFRIEVAANCPEPYELPILIQITSNDQLFWTDTCWVHVGSPTAVTNQENSRPKQFALYPNYPNPFNPSTTIRFDLTESRNVSLKVYTLLGEEVKTLIHGKMSVGEHQVQWNAVNQPAGVYLVCLVVAGFVQTRKMVVLR